MHSYFQISIFHATYLMFPVSVCSSYFHSPSSNISCLQSHVFMSPYTRSMFSFFHIPVHCFHIRIFQVQGFNTQSHTFMFPFPHIPCVHSSRSRCFHSQSLILPCSVTVHAVCISSPALRAKAAVLGTVPTLGFDIARFINQYQVLSLQTALITFYLQISLPSPLSRSLSDRSPIFSTLTWLLSPTTDSQSPSPFLPSTSVP